MFSMFGWACCACAFNVSPFPRVDFAPCVCVRACLRACVGMCYVNSTFYPSCLFETRSASSFFSSALVGLLLVGVLEFLRVLLLRVLYFSCLRLTRSSFSTTPGQGYNPRLVSNTNTKWRLYGQRGIN